MPLTKEKKKVATGQKKIDQLCINTIRFLSVDAVQKANSGHPGLPLDAAPMAFVLWTKFLKHNPAEPLWFNRDRFVLSAGHGSMLLYSLLYLTGYNLPLNQIERFRQWGSATPGHPERGVTPGVETTTGPLGQGFANGVGMAMAEAYLAARYNREGFEVISNYTFGLVSDGDLMEGISAEAASIAGHLKLGKLIYMYDCNHVSLASSTQLTFTDDHAKRFEAYGWQTISVNDGNDTAAIEQAINDAKEETGRPTLIIVQTHIGYGSPKQDSFKAHGSPLGVEDVKKTKENLGWPIGPAFEVPQEALDHFRKALDKGDEAEQDWKRLLSAYMVEYPDLAAELNQLISGEFPARWDIEIPVFPADAKGMATRVASGQVMQSFFKHLPGFIGGSADLNTSTHTELKDAGNFENPLMSFGDLQGSAGGGWNYAGRNLFFGVREHSMAGISNGLASYGGLLPFCATFLIFSDYMRPSLRLSAVMGLQVVFVFTHDSIGLGEDGTTHQPIEHLASLRAIPNLTVIRPADANETAMAWRMALINKNAPVALILTRQEVPTIDRKRFASAEDLRYGAYILEDADFPDLILIATGSEVSLIVKASELLKQNNISCRLVSMPSWELFEMQTQEYRDTVLSPRVKKRIAVEAGLSLGWQRYIGSAGDMISIEDFGSSAPGDVLMREHGFTAEHIYKRAMTLLGKESI